MSEANAIEQRTTTRINLVEFPKRRVVFAGGTRENCAMNGTFDSLMGQSRGLRESGAQLPCARVAVVIHAEHGQRSRFCIYASQPRHQPSRDVHRGRHASTMAHTEQEAAWAIPFRRLPMHRYVLNQRFRIDQQELGLHRQGLVT
jgi:hypothetical protein